MKEDTIELGDIYILESKIKSDIKTYEEAVVCINIKYDEFNKPVILKFYSLKYRFLLNKRSKMFFLYYYDDYGDYTQFIKDSLTPTFVLHNGDCVTITKLS